MRTTLALDDDLLATAQEYSGIKEKTALVNEALRRMIRQESAERLIRLGGSDPTAMAAPRRRSL
ncbi:type II toxin-antitoxin system VapB family antitoxin [Sphingomonas sp.]|uniref:type II toxin-antitoxin system VapB family antitoxin n=1 Tax=Sphingomonas sp. TaxID=28214 RepID=UPI0035BC8AEE